MILISSLKPCYSTMFLAFIALAKQYLIALAISLYQCMYLFQFFFFCWLLNFTNLTSSRPGLWAKTWGEAVAKLKPWQECSVGRCL